MEAITWDRLPAVLSAVGRSKTMLYEDIKQGLFPKAVRLGRQAVGWPHREVMVVVCARLAGKPDEEIRDVVTKLVEQRNIAEWT